jgi:hypothetical protein
MASAWPFGEMWPNPSRTRHLRQSSAPGLASQARIEQAFKGSGDAFLPWDEGPPHRDKPRYCGL